MTLNDKTILITGATGGIGAATCTRLATAGADIALVDLDVSAGEDLATHLNSLGVQAHFYRADVADDDEVGATVDAIVERFGRLDGAFNNAGLEQSNKPLHELTAKEWDRTIAVDLTGVFVCLKHEIRVMLERGGGSIVNTASSLGKVAIPNASDYIAAKHGVIGLTLAAATDYGTRGVRVNAVLPGITETPMIARISTDPQFAAYFDKLRERHVIGRFGQPTEIAASVEWLLSDAASFVTGAAIPVDGGFLAV